MKIKSLFTISLIFLSLIILVSCATEDSSLRTTLEKSWYDYLAAIKSGKKSELEKSMSSYRFRTMENNLVSANRSFTPEIIQSIAANAPDISKAEFESLLENGPTAGLVYVKDSDEKDSDGKPRVDFIFIKFVEEDEVWKVDGFMQIGGPKLQDDGSRTKFNDDDLPATYKIEGKVLQTPEPITAPEVTAMLDIFASGYKIQVIINGTEQANVLNTNYSGLIKGGIKKNNNKISISISQIEKNNPFKPSITVRCKLADKQTKECLKFEPKDKVEGMHEFGFDAVK